MPVYPFITEDGERVELEMTLAEYQRRVTNEKIMLEDGRHAWRTFEGCNFGGHLAGNWPMVSTAMGVAPEQVPEAMAIDARAGVPTHYTKDGDPILESRRHRRAYRKAHAFKDRNSGYGD